MFWISADISISVAFYSLISVSASAPKIQYRSVSRFDLVQITSLTILPRLFSTPQHVCFVSLGERNMN